MLAKRDDKGQREENQCSVLKWRTRSCGATFFFFSIDVLSHIELWKCKQGWFTRSSSKCTLNYKLKSWSGECCLLSQTPSTPFWSAARSALQDKGVKLLAKITEKQVSPLTCLLAFANFQMLLVEASSFICSKTRLLNIPTLCLYEVIEACICASACTCRIVSHAKSTIVTAYCDSLPFDLPVNSFQKTGNTKVKIASGLWEIIDE